MPDPTNLNQFNDINQAVAEQIQNILLKVMDPANEIDPKSMDAKVLQTLIAQGVRASGDIQQLIAKGVISEEEGKRRHEELKETLSLKTDNELKKIRAKGAEARAAKMTDTSSKLEVNEQKNAFTAEQKEAERAHKESLAQLSAEVEAKKAKGKAEAKVYLAKEEPLAAYRAEREIQRLKDDGAYQTAQDNYKIHHARMKHAIKIGAPLPVIPPEALAVMEPGGFKTKLTTLEADVKASRQLDLQRDKIKLGLNDSVALQPMESIVLQGGSHKPLLPHALKVQTAVTEATGALFKQGFNVSPGAEKVSLLKQPLWGGNAKQEAATEGIKKVLSLIGQTGKFDPASVGSVAQAVKSAGRMGGMTKLGIGGVGAYLLAKLLGGGEKAPEMTQEQQMMMAQQMQEQQQKAALVQSLIQQRQASSENDMAKAMLLKMQMMQGAGGGGGGVL